ncbi:MAG: gamma-glutamyltransferase, partial [Burkholderiaceae bacterium]
MSPFLRTLSAVLAAGILSACGGSDGASPSTGGGGDAPVIPVPPPVEPVPPVERTVVFDPALCKAQAGAPYTQTAGIAGTNIMVASADVNASLAGCRVLARGGSAADAAVAVQAVLGVSEPFASGLGGGSVVTYYDAATNKVRTYDGLSAAPSTVGASGTSAITSIYQAAV